MAKKNNKNTNANVNATIEKEATMAKEVIKNTEVEEITTIEEGTDMEENTTRTMLLFTASRGKNTKLAWNEITVDDNDPTVKVKGCAIELPVQAAELIGNDKFVSYIDKDIIAKCVDEQKAVRGTASTVSDVFNRYCKVTDTKGERVAVALSVFAEVLTAIEGGNTNGEWVRPEEEKAEEAPTDTIEAPEEAA